MITGDNSDNSLTCVGMFVYQVCTTCHLLSSDINECENVNICGFGTCANNDDGTFYQCTCQGGAMTTGSGNGLTCIG